MRLVAVLCVLCVTSVASAQLIFQPIQYQYGGQDPFYYGGSNPYVMARADRRACRDASLEPLRVYTDCIHNGITNAAIYGYSADDARNEAYGNIPLAFRMRDLIAHAESTRDGTFSVPPTAPLNDPRGSIEIKPYVRPLHREPHPFMILPKHLLDQPIATPKKVALWDRVAPVKAS